MGEVLGADFEFLDPFPRNPGVPEAVLRADRPRDDRAAIKLHLVLLGRDHDPSLLSRSDDGFRVDRFECVEVQHGESRSQNRS